MVYGLSEYESLKFLEEYGFQIRNNSNSRIIEIHCVKNNCCITYHEWPQFGDFNIFITKNIDDFKNHIYQKTYGSNWLLNNVLPQYQQATNHKKASKLELVEFYVKNQIKEKKMFLEF